MTGNQTKANLLDCFSSVHARDADFAENQKVFTQGSNDPRRSKVYNDDAFLRAQLGSLHDNRIFQLLRRDLRRDASDCQTLVFHDLSTRNTHTVLLVPP